MNRLSSGKPAPSSWKDSNIPALGGVFKFFLKSASVQLNGCIGGERSVHAVQIAGAHQPIAVIYANVHRVICGSTHDLHTQQRWFAWGGGPRRCDLRVKTSVIVNGSPVHLEPTLARARVADGETAWRHSVRTRKSVVVKNHLQKSIVAAHAERAVTAIAEPLVIHTSAKTHEDISPGVAVRNINFPT